MDSLEVRFRLNGQNAETLFCLVEQNISGEEKDGLILRCVNSSFKNYINLRCDYEFHTFLISDEDRKFFASDEHVDEKLANLYRIWEESQNLGYDVSSSLTDAENDEGYVAHQNISYSPENIYVENKPYSIAQICGFIDKGILNVTPNFQRNFIWGETQQSLLIESILLGFPLPAIYLSQFNDGSMSIVDGLQRISTIHRFVNNNLVLCNLEYLKQCEGCTYSQLEGKVSTLTYRLFDQTTIMCYVIGRRSPRQLKFDLFRRLNTGGVPLNNQEIRNCLSSNSLQMALNRMVNSDEFMLATGNRINNYRMDANELALRFIYFYDQYSSENVIGTYNGDMEGALNEIVDTLNEKTDFTLYESKFKGAMKEAHLLFGEYAFRKVFVGYKENSKRKINKSLLVAITVLLAHEKYHIYSDGRITDALARLLTDDTTFSNALTWSTTSVFNVKYVFESLKKMFDNEMLL